MNRKVVKVLRKVSQLTGVPILELKRNYLNKSSKERRYILLRLKQRINCPI